MDIDALNNNITNFGDISALRLGAIEYARDGGGTIDNFGTINNGTAGPLGSSSGIEIGTGDTVTINNHAGGSIRSGDGQASGISIRAGDHVIVNDGTIQGDRNGINVSVGRVQITNRGVITGNSGTAIRLGSRNNLLILDTGSTLIGEVTAMGRITGCGCRAPAPKTAT